MDLIYLFPDGMDINRNLERYFESNHLDEAIGTESWRDEIRKELQRYPPSQGDVRCPGATKIIFNMFQEQLRSIG
jgi:hypothetical protein